MLYIYYLNVISYYLILKFSKFFIQKCLNLLSIFHQDSKKKKIFPKNFFFFRCKLQMKAPQSFSVKDNNTKSTDYGK